MTIGSESSASVGADAVTAEPAPTPAPARRSFLSRALKYGVGTTLYKLHVVALIPLFAHFMPTAENGAIEVANFGGGLVAALAMMNFVPVASNRHVAAALEDRPRTLGDSALAMSLLAGGVLVLSPGLAWAASFALGEPGSRYWLLAATFAAAGLSAYVANMAYLLQLRSAQRAFSIIYATWALLVLAFTAVALLVFDAGAMGFATANLVAGLICSVMCVAALRRETVMALRRWGFRERLVLLGSYLRSSLPLLPMTLLAWVLLFADRRVLEATRGLEDVGVYGLATKIASAATVLLAPITAAWWDEGMNGDDAAVVRSVRRSFDAVLAIAAVSALAATAAWWLGADRLLGDDYGRAVPFVPLLALCAALNSLFLVPFGLLTRRGLYRAAVWAHVWACLVNVTGNLVLDRRFGIAGAVMSNVGGYLTLVVAACWPIRAQLRLALRGRAAPYAGLVLLSILVGAAVLAGA